MCVCLLPLVNVSRRLSPKWFFPKNRGGYDDASRVETAAMLLQGFARCVLSRQRIIRAANKIYRRVRDEECKAHFYSNLITGASGWTKPSVYLTEEPPLQLPEGASKHSPRVKREHMMATSSGAIAAVTEEATPVDDDDVSGSSADNNSGGDASGTP